MTTPKYASMATEDLKEGTGLFDDVNAKITGFKFSKEGPDNYTADGNPIFGWVDLLLDGDAPADERKAQQTYSLGAQAGDNFTISPDGFGLIPSDPNADAQLRKDSKWGTFISVLETAGFPKPTLQAGDMSALVGLYGHFKRVVDKERNFSEDQRTRPGQQKKSKFPPSTLVVTKILALPGQTVAATTTAATTTAAAPAAVQNAPAATTTAVGAEDLDLTTASILETVLKARGGSAQRSQLTLLLSKAAMDKPNRQDIARRGIDEAFLAEMVAAGLVKYDPAAKPQVVSLAA